METTYDKLINLLLDNWVIAVLVLISVILIAIPQVRDGIKMLCSLFKRKKEFVSEYADEKITFDVKLRSQDFDVVKIHATTHTLGVRAEREWLNNFYPGYENNMQLLDQITTDDGKTLTFDILPIHKGDKKKDIYFDITDFYSGAHVELTGSTHNYAKQKIRDIYNQ
jgi:hypothetical protein